MRNLVGGLVLRVLVESGRLSREFAPFAVPFVTVPVGFVLWRAPIA